MTSKLTEIKNKHIVIIGIVIVVVVVVIATALLLGGGKEHGCSLSDTDCLANAVKGDGGWNDVKCSTGEGVKSGNALCVATDIDEEDITSLSDIATAELTFYCCDSSTCDRKVTYNAGQLLASAMFGGMDELTKKVPCLEDLSAVSDMTG